MRATAFPTVLVLLVTLGCSAPTTQEHDRASPGTSKPELAGYWVSDPFTSQLGEATNALCLEKDGTFRMRFISQGPNLEATGKFRTEGKAVILDTTNGSSTTLYLEGTELVARNNRGDGYRLRRASATCR